MNPLSCHASSCHPTISYVGCGVALVSARHRCRISGLADARGARHSVVRKASPASFEPVWLKGPAEEIKEAATRQVLQTIQQVSLEVPGLRNKVNTTFVGPGAYTGSADDDALPIVFVPSFDSSLVEYRRLLPVLASAGVPAFAVDVVGWGFTEAGFATDPTILLGPQQKRDHLYAFWKEKIKRPMVVAGVSLGGAVALDFAVSHPEAVAKLVLVDAQAFTDGLGALSSLPRWLLVVILKQVLRAKWLRRFANTQAYHDVTRFATEDAMLAGRLHTFMPGWADANVAFIQSKGYSLSKRVSQVRQPCLVAWGAQDKILKPSEAQRFASAIPHAQIKMIEGCGHSPHLEKPEGLAALITAFLQEPAGR